jgi:predicted AlkP superfamily pyrophosphatase or phosphodiesterase
VKHIVILLAAVWLAGCAAMQAPAGPHRPPLILISIDGFRADYLRRGLTPTLARLAAEGATSPEGMRPSFPANTYPNHYTLVTGLRPDRHGIVHNDMEDPLIPGVTFSQRNRAAVKDRRWWDDATPFWVSAERADWRTSPDYWPGTEAAVQGIRPSLWRPYDQKTSSADRVDYLLGALDARRPFRYRFFTLYFDVVDTAGHAEGPNGAAVEGALRDVDAAVARLLAGLAARGLEGKVNLVIVSDHGMAAVPPDHVIYLDEAFAPLPVRVIASGAVAALAPLPGREAEAERVFLRPDPRFQCWRKDEVPERFQYGRHRRVAPIVCLATTGWYLTTREAQPSPSAGVKGQHGFDPYDPTMAALFISHGPSIRPGAAVAPFDNVHVYPLLVRLTGVKQEPSDGDLAVLAPLMK